MLRDITLGQYYRTESIIHKLDPRVKIIGTFVFLVAIFMVNNAIGYAIAGLFLVMNIKLSNVPVKFIFRGMRSIFLLLMISVLFNLFLTPGDPVVTIWKLQITSQGIVMAVHMVFRLSFLVIGSSIMTLTTTPNQLTDGLEKGLGWMRRLHVPVHEIAMMMSIALRFIPILTDEANRIMSAQEARGADFHSGGLIRRAKALIPLLVPLFVSAFRRANDLAQAMESRAYHGGEGRTKMKPLIYQKRDYISYGIIAAFALAMFLAWRFGPKVL